MENLLSFSPLVVAIVPVVLGLVEVLKQMGLPSRYSPLTGIVFGIGISWILGSAWPLFVTQGLLIGLAASGAYSGVKKQITG